MAAVLWLTRLAFVAFNVLLGIVFVMTNTDHCASVFEMKVGYALCGHVMSRTVVVDEFECQQKCLGNNSCKSFNVLPGADNKKHICELNNKTRKMKPRDFKKKKGATYYGSVKISCVDISHENKKTNRLSDQCHPGYSGKRCERRNDDLGVDCLDIKTRGHSKGDGMYWLDPDGGNHSNAFQAYCDMTSYNGGWTMCYTTDEYAKPRTEVAYNTWFSYGTDGYRTNCNNIPFTEIIFIDHQTGEKAYFKQATNQQIKASDNYSKRADTYGLWNGFGAMNGSYSYQLLICDISFYSGFFVSGHTNCYKACNDWCVDTKSPYFRTASTSSSYKGVAFNVNGHKSAITRLMSVGLR